FPAQLTGLLRNPNCVRMYGKISQMHPPGPEFDEEQDIHGLQRRRFNGEEIAGQHLLFVVPQKGAPIAALVSLRGWDNPSSLQYVLHRCAINEIAKFEEFSRDPIITPVGILIS